MRFPYNEYEKKRIFSNVFESKEINNASKDKSIE